MLIEHAELFKDDKYAQKELLTARNYMTNKNTTEEQWEQIKKVVGMIYFYANENISKLAHATLLELTMREPYMWKIWQNQS